MKNQRQQISRANVAEELMVGGYRDLMLQRTKKTGSRELRR